MKKIARVLAPLFVVGSLVLVTLPGCGAPVTPPPSPAQQITDVGKLVTCVFDNAALGLVGIVALCAPGEMVLVGDILADLAAILAKSQSDGGLFGASRGEVIAKMTTNASSRLLAAGRLSAHH
jgi:hypothetical protein